MRRKENGSNIDTLIEQLEILDPEAMRRLERVYGKEVTQARKRYLSVLNDFKKRYPSNTQVVIVRAGGRIILSGEYLDYQHGHVLNACCAQDTIVVLSGRLDAQVHIASRDFTQVAPVQDVDMLHVLQRSREAQAWWESSVSTLRVMRDFMKARELNLPGVSILIDSDSSNGGLPVGVGLSSSGALGVSLLKAIGALIGAERHLDSRTITALVMKSEEALGFFPGPQDPWACLQTSAVRDTMSANLIDCKTAGIGRMPVSRSSKVRVPNAYSALVFRILGKEDVARGRWAHNHSVLESELACMIVAKNILRMLASDSAIGKRESLRIRNHCSNPPDWKPVYFTKSALIAIGLPKQRVADGHGLYDVPDGIALADVDIEETFGPHAHERINRMESSDPHIRSRRFFFSSALKHFFTEEERVLGSVRALKDGNMKIFLELQQETHKSLIQNCRVSNPTITRFDAYVSKNRGPIQGHRVLGPGGGANILIWILSSQQEEVRDWLEAAQRDIGIPRRPHSVVGIRPGYACDVVL